jgi:hypothetical protein
VISYWRIVPKRIGPDDFVHRFKSHGEAEATLTAMRKRHVYCVAPFNKYGKRIDAMPERSADMSEAPGIEPIEDITDEDMTALAEQTGRSDVRSEADQSESVQLEAVARALAEGAGRQRVGLDRVSTARPYRDRGVRRQTRFR